MIEVNHSVVIERPVEDVFSFMSEARNDPLWQDDVEACIPDREPMVGQQRDVVMKIFGRQTEGSAEVTEYDPDRRLTIETQSGLPVDARTTYEFEPVEGGTRIVLTGEAEPKSTVLKLIRPITARMMQRQWESRFATLKELLEDETRSESGARKQPNEDDRAT